MSIKQKNSDTAAPKGSAWKKNVIFALVVLALAAGIFLAVRAQHRQGQRLTGRCGFR